MMWVALSIIIVGLVTVVMAALAISHIRSLKAGSKIKDNKWIGIGIAIGMPLGLPMGIAIGNIALGAGWGIPIGLAFGAALQQKYGKMITLTKELKKQMVWGSIAGTITLAAGLIVLLTLMLLQG